MAVTRRDFLAIAGGTCFGLAGRACGEIADWTRGRVDEAEEHFAQLGAPCSDSGYLDEPAAAIDDCLRRPQSPYQPRAGDVVFSRSKNWIYRVGHRLAGAGEPSHSAIVWQRHDRSFAVLEAGPFDVPIIRSMELAAHLTAYNGRGHVWVRRRAEPLSPAQVCRLAEFAAKQDGKPFARLRLLGQVTPFRSRGPWRTYFLGQSHGSNRHSYFCSELVVEALIDIGAIAAADARPSATYPTDLFFNDSRIRFLHEHFRLECWLPPQRWRPCLAPLGGEGN